MRFGDLSIPAPSGFVNDFAGVLDPREEGLLEGFLRALDEKTGAQLVLVTIPSLAGESRDDVAVRLFEQWKIGREDDRGLLLLDAIEERQMRVEVGYGLEGILPDGKVGRFRDEYFTEPLRGKTSLTPQDRFTAYGGMLQAMAAEVARERGLTLDDIAASPPAAGGRRPRNGDRRGLIPLVILFLIFMFLFRRNPLLGLLLLTSMGGGRRGGGGGGSFGGFGGGFGGFGGGGSGGGGAGGSY